MGVSRSSDKRWQDLVLGMVHGGVGRKPDCRNGLCCVLVLACHGCESFLTRLAGARPSRPNPFPLHPTSLHARGNLVLQMWWTGPNATAA